MSRSTEVGRAYVAVEINGDGMNEDIVDAVDGAGPGVEKAGEEHGEKYGDGFEEGFFDRITDTLSKHLEKELDKDFKNLGGRLGRSLSKSLGSAVGDKIDDIEVSVSRMLDNLENRLSKVSGNGGGGGGSSSTPTGAGDAKPGDKYSLVKQMNMAAMFEKARLDLHAKANADIAKNDADLVKSQQAILDLATKHHEAMIKENAAIAQKFAEKRISMQVASNLAIEKDDARLIKAQEALYKQAAKENAQREANETRRGSKGSAIGATIGGMLGAGSRNNFLNLFGKSLGNVIGLVDKAGSAVKPLFAAFNSGFSQAAEGASFLQKTLGGLSQMGVTAGATGSKMFTGLISSGPAAAAAIALVVVAMSVMVSVASALLAIVTALTATIVSGLTGALLVLGGALSAVVAAGGLLTAAFMSMTDAQKTLLKDAFQPLKAEMVGIGQIMLQDMVPAFATWSANLQKALMLAVPVAQVMGAAFAEAGNTLTASFSGPGFQAFANALGVYLPSIVQNLSLALGSFLNGLTGTFAALMPFVNQFAGYLAQVAERFSQWANSAGGQNAIVDFTTRALASLQSLWNFVREFTGFLADVLFSPEAQNFGNGMFDGLARSFEGLRQKIADGALEKWFEDAARFGAQLWSVIQGIGDVIGVLNSSGVLGAVATSLGVLATIMKFAADLTNILQEALGFLGGAFGPLGGAMVLFLGPIGLVVSALGHLVDTAKWAFSILNAIPGVNIGGGGGGTMPMSDLTDAVNKGLSDGKAVQGKDNALANRASDAARATAPTMPGLINSGNNALAQTGVGSGGTKAQAKIPKYVNPYVEWANKLIKDGPTMAQKIKTAMKALNKQIVSAITDAETSTDSAAVRKSMIAMGGTIRDSAAQTVSTAQSALNSAAQSLAGATSKSAAKKALAEVKKTQKDLAAAVKSQKALNKAASIVAGQGIIREDNVQKLMRGYMAGNATLAEYAEARERLAVQIDAANQKLADAISMRDQYNSQVSESVRSFGSILTAQAQTINGVQQALTAGDITSNLTDRLTKIRDFQSNLRILLAQGLSNAAYKQIVDGGVEEGGAIADALIKGGTGAIGQVNDLVGQIDGVAANLGLETSSRLYQAGVDAAQGLVDGLNSLSGQLDSAAARLGDSIAASLKRALGIASPSKVMYAAMGYVGDGLEEGLDDQQKRVGLAATRLSDQIRISPAAAEYANMQAAPRVSGNSDDPRIGTLIVQTPTEDPKAVAQEVVNEIVGRL